MRKILGRVALLLGVILVGGAAWWGAMSLFEVDDPEDDSSSDVDCAAVAKKAEVIPAQRAFVKEYGDAPWFKDTGIDRTEEGFVLLVTVRKDRRAPELPGCPDGVPLVLRGGPPQTG